MTGPDARLERLADRIEALSDRARVLLMHRLRGEADRLAAELELSQLLRRLGVKTPH